MPKINLLNTPKVYLGDPITGINDGRSISYICMMFTPMHSPSMIKCLIMQCMLEGSQTTLLLR